MKKQINRLKPLSTEQFALLLVDHTNSIHHLSRKVETVQTELHQATVSIGQVLTKFDTVISDLTVRLDELEKLLVEESKQEDKHLRASDPDKGPEDLH